MPSCVAQMDEDTESRFPRAAVLWDGAQQRIHCMVFFNFPEPYKGIHRSGLPELLQKVTRQNVNN